ncbi:MAG: hypothetical protein E7298_00460 [Lachnospiraceae bacterium]|nr:hypothetical protein [Lachnospiraceae bacterium]
MDIDTRLDSIIYRYKLDAVYPRYRDKRTAENLIRKLVRTWESSRVLCIATSYVCRYYFNNFIYSENVDFAHIEKGNWQIGLSESHGIDLEMVDWRKYDVVCLIAYNGESVIGHFLRNKGVQYISLYDYFALNGLFLDHEWYDFMQNDSGYLLWDKTNNLKYYRAPAVIEYYELVQKYNYLQRSIEERIIYLKKIIFISLYIRDFIALFNWFDELQVLSHLQDYIEAKKEIKSLLSQISRDLNSRKERDIIIHWIDKVPYEDLEKIPFISKTLRPHSINFRNMYTMTPYTMAAFGSLFAEKRPVDDMGWFSKTEDVENSNIYKEIKKKGYRFSSVSWDLRFFPNGDISDATHDEYTTASKLMWDGVRQILLSEDPIVILMQIAIETHDPSWSTNMKDSTISSGGGTWMA